MENKSAEAKRIIVTAKGFSDLGEKGIENLVKVSEDFLTSGKCVWAMADYMGITGAGKGAGKHASFMKQLDDSKDLDSVKKLAGLVPQVMDKMADVTFGLQIESVALRAYFSPLLKARGEIAATPEVAKDELGSIEI